MERKIVAGIAALLFWTSMAGGQESDPLEARRRRENPVVLAVRKARNSVVNISVERKYLRKSAPSVAQSLKTASANADIKDTDEAALGSGVIVDPDGYLITCEHLIRGLANVNVTLANKKKYDARVLAVDRRADLALLKIDGGDQFAPIIMGMSQDLMIGETVIAVGNPDGLENTVTTGVLSATDRTLEIPNGSSYKNLIQTDAPINPGNSGGPLLNINGELIGINTAIHSDAQGIGFAIPVNQVKKIIIDLIKNSVDGGYVGLDFSEFVEDGRIKIAVRKIDPRSPADEANFRQDDQIYKLDGTRVANQIELEKRIASAEPGQRVTFEVLRSGRAIMLAATVAKKPRTPVASQLFARYGLSCQTLTAPLAKELDLALSAGVIVTKVLTDGPAFEIGIRENDVLTMFDGKAVTSIDDLTASMKHIRTGDKVRVMIWRGATAMEGVLIAN